MFLIEWKCSWLMLSIAYFYQTSYLITLGYFLEINGYSYHLHNITVPDSSTFSFRTEEHNLTKKRFGKIKIQNIFYFFI